MIKKFHFRYLIAQFLVASFSIFSLFEIAHANCIGGVIVEPDSIIIENYDYSSGDIADCITTGNITLGSAINIPNNAALLLFASDISITANIEVLLGGQLRIFAGAKPLNDTGVVDCSNFNTNNQPCPVLGYPGQDAEYGRDITHPGSKYDGHAGFSFRKVCNSGTLAGDRKCPTNPALGIGISDWGCTKDNVTGLIWEVKTDNGGLRDKDHTYTWYNTNNTINGGDAGTQDGGNCLLNDDCDTQSYVQAINTQGMCGANDWRMPTIKELENIASLDRYFMAIDMDYFPTMLVDYWSASPYANQPFQAWAVNFYIGSVYYNNKSYSNFVLLVRDGQ